MSGHDWPGQGGTTLGAVVSRVRKERLDGGLCNGTWLGKLLEPINGATGGKILLCQSNRVMGNGSRIP